MVLSFILSRLVSTIQWQSCHYCGVANGARGSQSPSSREWARTVSSIGASVLGNMSVSGCWLSVLSSSWGILCGSSLSSPLDPERLLAYWWEHECVERQWRVRPLCRAKTLPHAVQIKDCIVECEKFEIEYPLEIAHSEALIMYPNAVYSAYPKQTWMPAYPPNIIVSHTIFKLGLYYL